MTDFLDNLAAAVEKRITALKESKTVSGKKVDQKKRLKSLLGMEEGLSPYVSYDLEEEEQPKKKSPEDSILVILEELKRGDK